jgi:N-acetylmuramoyl-L-alanine amidase CwlA
MSETNEEIICYVYHGNHQYEKRTGKVNTVIMVGMVTEAIWMKYGITTYNDSCGIYVGR